MRKVRSYTEEEQQEILCGQKSSGLSVGAYCRKQGIPPSTFYTWRRDKEESVGVKKQGFIKVKTVAGVIGSNCVQIKTPEGYHLEVPIGADGRWVQGIIEAVRIG